MSIYNEKIEDPVRTQRSYLMFESGIRARDTERTYKIYLEHFKKFAKVEDYDSLISMNENDRKILIEDYILYNKRKHRYTSLDTILSAITKFFVMNDIAVNTKKLRSLFPEKEKTLGDKAYTNEDVKLLLDQTKILKHKALIHVLASSGMRAGAICDIQLKHLKDMPHNCKCVLVYAGSRDEYTTFISPEATEALEYYFEQRRQKGEKLNPDSYLFVTRQNKQFAYNWVTMLMCRLARNLLQRRKVANNNYDKKGSHALRKRFNTIVKLRPDCNLSLAERLMGHSTTIQLDNSYFRPNDDQLFSEYLKVLPDLMIDEKYRLRDELEKKQNKIDELQSSKERILLMESQLSEIQEHIKNLKA